jgi:hypothetical protein
VLNISFESLVLSEILIEARISFDARLNISSFNEN